MSALAHGEEEHAPLLLVSQDNELLQAREPTEHATADVPALPAWYTPKRLLVLFCCMQLLVYMDRGVGDAPAHVQPALN
jgi:hypothetical protein